MLYSSRFPNRSMSIISFLEKNYKHFNARETLDAAKGWHEFCGKGGKMVLAMAGAMSTAEIGIPDGNPIFFPDV